MEGLSPHDDSPAPPGRADQSHRAPESLPVCPNCLKPSPALQAYCPSCGMPMGMFAATDPMQAIQSSGWAYRRALRGRSGRLVLLGMWVIFAPTMIALAGSAIEIIRSEAVLESLVPMVLGFGLAAIYVTILYRLTRNHVRERRYQAGYCGVCRYSLRGLTEPRCPECGTSFDEDLLDRQSDGAPKP
jgi:hypothetical protein